MERATYVALDLETTGLTPERDQIIEVGVVKFAGQRVLDTFSSFVNPNQSIPFQVTQLTGIHDKDVTQAPTIDLLLPTISQFIGDSIILGHNVGFDRAFLASAGLRLRNRSIDTFELANIVFPHATRYSLTALANDLGVTLTSAHRALDDANATRQVFLVLCERAKELPLPLLEKINRVSQGTHWSLAGLLQGVQLPETQVVGASFEDRRLEFKGQGFLQVGYVLLEKLILQVDGIGGDHHALAFGCGKVCGGYQIGQ